MRISILCSDKAHPIRPHLEAWAERHRSRHEVGVFERKDDLRGGDILFLISCHEIVRADTRGLFTHALVVHAADLPKGRGWSPHIWTILEGGSRVVVTLLEAADAVDTGRIWHKLAFDLEGHELYDEINARLFDTEIRLMDFAVENAGQIAPQPQPAEGASYYRKRKPEDSKLDPDRSIREQFALLRVADPERYPAFVDIAGRRYDVLLRKRGI